MNRERITSKIAAEPKSKEKRPDKDRGDRRDIGDFEYDRSKAKVLKKALHNLNVSLGTLFGAMKDLSMLRGSEITPDGKLGGSGFIMGFREMKSTLSVAISQLSDITDTIADELTNPKWGLDPKEISKIEKDKEQEILDWAETEETRELEEMQKAVDKKAVDSVKSDPVKDPDNVKWMQEQMAKAKQQFGESFGEDIEESFDEE